MPPASFRRPGLLLLEGGAIGGERVVGEDAVAPPAAQDCPHVVRRWARGVAGGYGRLDDNRRAHSFGKRFFDFARYHGGHLLADVGYIGLADGFQFVGADDTFIAVPLARARARTRIRARARSTY